MASRPIVDKNLIEQIKQKYGDLAMLEWLFNQSTVLETLKYIGVKEDLNSHFNEEFCL